MVLLLQKIAMCTIKIFNADSEMTSMLRRGRGKREFSMNEGFKEGIEERK